MVAAKKVLLADHCAIYREGLKQVIGSTVGIIVAGEASSGAVKFWGHP